MVLVPLPTAIQRDPVQATSFPLVENTVELMAVQVIPFAEYAMELVPWPTATHCFPFHAT